MALYKHISCMVFFFTTLPLPSLFCSTSNTDVFEFGENTGKLEFSTTGDIGILPKHKVTIIPIKVPDCTKISYIRVDVYNIVAPPFVKFDDDISSIIIKYRPLQASVSSYVIIAKTKNVDCNNKSKSKKKSVHL